MKRQKKLLPIKAAVEEIMKFLGEDRFEGVQGFSITVRSKLSTVNLKWGDLKIKGRNP